MYFQVVLYCQTCGRLTQKIIWLEGETVAKLKERLNLLEENCEKCNTALTLWDVLIPARE